MAVAPRPLTPINEPPTSVYSDCPGCARQRGVAGRTRDDHPTTMVHGQVMVGWWWSSQVSRRPSAGFCVDPWGYPLARAMRLMWSGRWLKAAATRRHSLCRCPARCARNAGKGMTGGRGWDGGEGRGGLACGLGPGVGDLACARYWGNVRVGGGGTKAALSFWPRRSRAGAFCLAGVTAKSCDRSLSVLFS
jgi:hypothetical protein